jgi:CrcB protein
LAFHPFCDKNHRVWIDYLIISLGGALGTAARYWLATWVALRFGETFPFGTMIINVLGSFIIGFFAALTLPEGRLLVSPQLRNFVMIGICGGFTTFSSFSFQTLRLLQDGQITWASLNILGSVILCLVGVWLGYALAMMMNGARVA